MWLYLDTSDQSPTAKSIPIVKESCSHEWPGEKWKLHPFGMILEPSQPQNLRNEILTLSSAAFHARILVLLDMEEAWKESEADCFSRSYAWPKKSSPVSYSLKTSQLSHIEVDFEWLEKLPRWGMIVDGVLYPLHPLEHCIEEKGGFYWPTPRANKIGGYASPGYSPTLETAVKMYATPCASQANKPIREPSLSRQKGEHGEDIQDSVGRLNPSNIGKKLCPKWVSVLMGFPIMWLDLDHSVMQWYRSKSKKRSKS